MVERTAESIRDGEQAAAERHQAQMEMEQALVAQKQRFSRDTSPIVEQADGSDNVGEDAENVVTTGHAGGSSGDVMGGTSIGAPGAGTDPSETATSHGQAAADTGDHGPDAEDAVEYEGDERTFEGSGRHSLDEQ